MRVLTFVCSASAFELKLESSGRTFLRKVFTELVFSNFVLIFSKFSSYYSDKNQRNSVSSFYIKIAFILNVIIYSTLHTSSVVNCALFAVANTGC